MVSEQCWGVTARKARHNSSNVRGVTAGKVRHKSSPNNLLKGENEVSLNSRKVPTKPLSRYPTCVTSTIRPPS